MNRSFTWTVVGTSLAVAGGVLAAAPAEAHAYACIVSGVTYTNTTDVRYVIDTRGVVSAAVDGDGKPIRVTHLEYAALAGGRATVQYTVKCDGRVKKSKWNRKKGRYVTKKRWAHKTYNYSRVESVLGHSGWQQTTRETAMRTSREAAMRAAITKNVTAYQIGDVWRG